MADPTPFDSIARNRDYDSIMQRPAVKLLPGECHVTNEDLVQVKVLGSCVSACIRDATSGIGGMNHFMLPDAGGGTAEGFGNMGRYGVHAMDLLLCA